MEVKVRQKLQETRGDIMISASIILLCFSILLVACLECAHVWTTCDITKEKTKEAVLAVAAINVENVYNGVRESVGQARAVDAAGTTWMHPVSSEEVMDILTANMGLARQGSVLTKYTESGTEVEFKMKDFQTSYNNDESGLNFITTYQLEIPIRIGRDVLPPIHVNMEARSTYEKLF